MSPISHPSPLRTKYKKIYIQVGQNYEGTAKPLMLGLDEMDNYNHTFAGINLWKGHKRSVFVGGDNFELTGLKTVPILASIWLFGTGLIGLISLSKAPS
jgi:hypothetical protein